MHVLRYQQPHLAYDGIEWQASFLASRFTQKLLIICLMLRGSAISLMPFFLWACWPPFFGFLPMIPGLLHLVSRPKNESDPTSPTLAKPASFA